MTWTGPTIELHSLSCGTATKQISTVPTETSIPLHEFVAIGSGFRDESQLLFVRVNDPDGSLKPFQAISCAITGVTGTQQGTEVKFTASLYERDSGPYHLVAWNPTADGMNDLTTLEFAMGVTAEPGGKINVEVNAKS
jgi:hypothetical protein